MNKWSELTELLSQLPVFDSINATKKQLDDIRPLPEEIEGRVMQKLRLEWNYHSNAIEGNKLTYGETYSFLMYGLTAKGKPFKDHLDIKGHNEAINFLTSLVKDERDLTEGDVRDLHKIILVEPYQSAAQTPDGQETTKTISIGEYKKLPNHVKTLTGEIHYYATPEEVPIKMHEWVQWYNQARHNKKIHPSVLAAFVHHRFVAIHPFDDGNGRLARILMNLILMKNGYPPAIIKLKERTDYYAALNQADKNEYVPIIEFVAEAVLESMNLYLKAAKGESIEDSSDLDKEIALFKRSFEKTYKQLDLETCEKILKEVLYKIGEQAAMTFSKFNDLFNTSSKVYRSGNDVYYTNWFIDYSSHLQHIISQAEVAFFWSGFKKTPNTFDFSTTLKIKFGQTQYQIINDSTDYKENILKYYDEVITDDEIKMIADNWTRSAFQSLKNEVENSKK